VPLIVLIGFDGYSVAHLHDGLRNRDDWAKITTIGMVYSQRAVGEKTSEETRYFIGNKVADARCYGTVLRSPSGGSADLADAVCAARSGSGRYSRHRQ
jgi:hypothetical protein